MSDTNINMTFLPPLFLHLERVGGKVIGYENIKLTIFIIILLLFDTLYIDGSDKYNIAHV